MNQGCALCGTFEDICIDHCHATGKVRGPLCQRCNRKLGHIESDQAWLDRALSYLGWQ